MTHYDQAMDGLDRTLSTKADDAETFFQRGWLKAVVGDWTEASVDFERARSLDPSYGPTIARMLPQAQPPESGKDSRSRRRGTDR